MTRTLIVGGGLAGPAAAIRLAQLGHPSLVLERQEAAHDKICGEFLSAEAVEQLAALGLETHACGALPIDRVRLMAGRRTASARLPFVAHSVRRRTLDAALLAHAERCGVEVHRGVHVRRMAGASLDTSAGVLREGPVVVATGKHAMPGVPRDWLPGDPVEDHLVGFKMYAKATPALARRLARTVEVVAYEGGYAGVQLVAPDVVNLCLVIGKAPLKALGGEWARLRARLAAEPALAPILDTEPLLDRPLTISGVPYGYLRHPTALDAGYAVGDQAAVIPSFCGDGMAIALHSGVLAAEAIHDGLSPERFHARLRQVTAPPVSRAMRLQRLLHAPWGRTMLLMGLAGFPGVIRLLARATRIAPPPAPPAPGAA